MNISADLVQRALDKLASGQTACDVAAIFVGQSSPRGQDGVSWRFVVADPNGWDTIVGTVSGTRGGAYGMAVDEQALEAEVEDIACGYARETRLADLVAASPIQLMRKD